jgi:hypothetical protein
MKVLLTKGYPQNVEVNINPSLATDIVNNGDGVIIHKELHCINCGKVCEELTKGHCDVCHEVELGKERKKQEHLNWLAKHEQEFHENQKKIKRERAQRHMRNAVAHGARF